MELIREPPEHHGTLVQWPRAWDQGPIDSADPGRYGITLQMSTWLVTGLVLSLCVVEAVVIALLLYRRAARRGDARVATRGEISCALAHELNQPLTAILQQRASGGARPRPGASRSR